MHKILKCIRINLNLSLTKIKHKSTVDNDVIEEFDILEY